MPLPIKKFDKLAVKPEKGVKRKQWTLNLSEKCGILPNCMTNKYGKCKRYAHCQFRGNVGCVARGNE